MERMTSLTQATFVSIVIPTYNRPQQLTACLHACARLDYPRDRFEVIVVDDGGATPLDGVVAQFHGQLTLRLLRQVNKGPSAARNRGAAEARGDILAFTDDDCLPTEAWLQALAAKCAAAPGCAVGGRTLNALPHNPYSTASQLLASYVLTYYNAAPESARFFPSNNLAFPTERFRAIGGFDETFLTAEDRELCDRWLHLGYRLVCVEEAVAYHAHTLNLRTFLRQHLRYGQGAFNFHVLRAHRGQHRIKVEPAAFYFNMLRYPFETVPPVKAARLAVLIGLSQVASAAGLFREKARRRS